MGFVFPAVGIGNVHSLCWVISVKPKTPLYLLFCFDVDLGCADRVVPGHTVSNYLIRISLSCHAIVEEHGSD